MRVTNSLLETRSSMGGQAHAPANASAVPFSKVFAQVASQQPPLAPATSPAKAGVREKSHQETAAVRENSAPFFSMPEHAPPGSDMPPGLCEALYSLTNQPGLTNEERMQISIYSLYLAKHGPGFEGIGTGSFDPVRALVAMANVLGERYPNISRVATEWAASYQPTAAEITG